MTVSGTMKVLEYGRGGLLILLFIIYIFQIILISYKIINTEIGRLSVEIAIQILRYSALLPEIVGLSSSYARRASLSSNTSTISLGVKNAS
jgi:hypothetical protein